MPTSAPASARRVVIAGPLPREAPVTRVLLPSRSDRPVWSGIGLSLWALTGSEGILHEVLCCLCDRADGRVRNQVRAEVAVERR
jgi:hypothetical protein